jgi:phage shock protein C
VSEHEPGEQQPPEAEAPETEEPTTVEQPRATAAPPPQQQQLLRRSRDRVIAGVCGGLGRYLGIDPVLVRIAALLLLFASGVGILLYIIGWIAIPEEAGEAGDAGVAGAQPVRDVDEGERTRGAVVLGLAFVALGIFFLLDEAWPDFLSWEYVWPVALIAVGLAIVLRGRR